MPAIFNLNRLDRQTLWLAAALLTVYIVWGTTYFALDIAMQTLPPVLMNGLRFVLAGVLMLAIARWQGQAWPTAAQWRASALIGGLMAFGAMALVVLAQQAGIAPVEYGARPRHGLGQRHRLCGVHAAQHDGHRHGRHRLHRRTE